MLCRKLRQTFAKTTLNYNVHYQCLITSRYISKRCIFDSVFALSKSESRARMSSIRFMLKDLSVSRFWVAWTRSFIVNNVVKRCRRERSVREVIQCFRQTIFKPRRTFLLSATAAFKRGDDDDTPPSCEQNITDEDLEALVTELEGVEQLSRSTLFCTICGRRLVIEKQLPGVRYCACKEPKPPEESPDGWVPYMEAEDVVIWRKEYKHGQGLYAYKVYGRYKEVLAQDFAAVQVDGAYRRVWDQAVASLSVVERRANGVGDQAVLHWEVLWPRLFANRDYVYIRRHKEFDVKTPSVLRVFEAEEPVEPPPDQNEQPSVHSRAKRKSQENDRLQERNKGSTTIKDNKVFIIISRSCSHPKVPVTKHAIRVNEYWSHMVVKSIDGVGEPGMEFVLTYYDEPAVGGLPGGVASWATGRAAPLYLGRMRRAAAGYRSWGGATDRELPDFTPFGAPDRPPDTPTEVSLVPAAIREQDMESSKDGPDMDNGNGNGNGNSTEHKDESTQTEPGAIVAPPAGHIKETRSENEPSKGVEKVPVIKAEAPAEKETTKEKVPVKAEAPAEKEPAKEEEPSIKQEGESEKPEEEEENNGNGNGSWWRYLYPFYYFV